MVLLSCRREMVAVTGSQVEFPRVAGCEFGKTVIPRDFIPLLQLFSLFFRYNDFFFF